MAWRDLIGRVPVLGRARPPLVTVLRLAGTIGQIGPVRRGLVLADLAETIERAFRPRGLKAVAVVVNSPGGSAVQSALIMRRIRALSAEKKVPVLTFAEDVAASGGYWLLLAGDEIFADGNSIVGSIGVVSAGFGLAGLIRRLGVERRLYTAGERKVLLDPFRREDPAEVERLRAIQRDVHESFQTVVRERRGSHLAADEATLFSGEFWTGRRALELGLIDGLGDVRTVMRERYGERVQLRAVGVARPWWRRRLGFDAGALAAEAAAALEERLMWGRFGL